MSASLTLSDLAKWIDGDIVRGEPDLVLSGMASLDQAGPDDASFLGNEKYHAQFIETKAGVVIVGRDVTDGPAETALIAVDNPTLAFSTVVSHFVESTRGFAPGVHDRAVVDIDADVDADAMVHAGAVVMAGAKVGKGSEIGPNVVVGAGAVVGEDCVLMANSTLRERCTLGDRVILQPGAVVGSDGFGYELKDGKHVKIDQVGIVEVHSDVEIGGNSTIDRARFGKTIIGEGTKIDNLVQIGHNCVIGKHCIIVALTGIAGSAVIGDYVIIAVIDTSGDGKHDLLRDWWGYYGPESGADVARANSSPFDLPVDYDVVIGPP